MKKLLTLFAIVMAAAACMAPACAEADTDIRIGDVITYGHYEQDNDTSNGAEPIEWLVLDHDADKGEALLISRFALKAVVYHHEGPYPTWEKSDVRTWLNDDFMFDAFTESEQACIRTVAVNTPSYEGIGGGGDTQDRIWLLSREEAERYFENNEDRMAESTPYADSVWAYTGSKGLCWWWLRSPGHNENDAAIVLSSGAVYSYPVYDTLRVVRPAFVLDLNAAGMQ